MHGTPEGLWKPNLLYKRMSTPPSYFFIYNVADYAVNAHVRNVIANSAANVALKIPVVHARAVWVIVAPHHR